LNYVNRVCPMCSTTFNVNQSDPNPLCDLCNFKSEMADDYEEAIINKKPARCFDHKWVWSGVPRGSVWCSKCDTTYDEKLHGEIKDLSGNT
jgi:uncharacterized Zn-finger protein